MVLYDVGPILKQSTLIRSIICVSHSIICTSSSGVVIGTTGSAISGGTGGSVGVTSLVVGSTGFSAYLKDYLIRCCILRLTSDSI